MKRHVRARERRTLHTKVLPKLQVGDHVLIQNQTGNHARKWDRTGRIVEAKDFDQYLVKVDGSGRVSLRNRKFLRTFTPYVTQPAPRVFQSPLPGGPGLQEQAPALPAETLGSPAVEEEPELRTRGPVEVPASPVREEEPQRRVETPTPEEPPAPRREERGRPARQRREPGWMKDFVRY